MDAYRQHYGTAETLATVEQDAQSDVRKILWLFIGFFGNVLGILIASAYEPTPPASRLLGKSPEYAAVYVDSYKAKSRSIQVHQTIIGLALAIGFMILLAILL